MKKLSIQNLTIKQKLFLIVMTPTLSVLLVACLLLGLYDAFFLRQSVEDELRLSAALVGHNIASELRSGNRGGAEATLHSLEANQRILAAALYDSQGQILARYFRDREVRELPQRPPAAPLLEAEGDELRFFHSLEFNGRVQGTVFILADLSHLRTRIVFYMSGVLLIVLMCSLLAFLLMSRLQGIISAPIAHLSLLARIITEQKDYSVRAMRHGNDELGNLVDQFNNMLMQIEQRDRALEQARAELEERVNDRTRRLQEEIRHHEQTEATLQREIGARKAAQAQLQHSKDAAEAASRSKSDFLATMSHEIRTPMNGVIGMTELLLTTPLTAQQQKYTEAIRRSGRDLLKVVGDILDYSKVEAGQLLIEPIAFNLQVACEDVVELLSPRADQKGLSLILRYAPGVPSRIVGDAARIRQVLTNLIANAIKFTHEGHVLLNVEMVGQTDEKVALRFVVEDTGIGTPTDKLESIFGKYAQADTQVAKEYGGTGLGLAISKHLVDLMGGQIGVQSREGVGSRFYFTLFLSIDKTPRQREEGPSSLAGVRILIVDHSGLNRQVLLEQVTSWSMRADSVGSSSEALKFLREAAANGTPYNITLIDDQMPGVRGESLGRTIKSEPEIRDTKLVLLTALGQRGDAQRVLELGFSAYLTRPIRQSELMDALASLWSAHLRGERLGLITRHTVAEQRRSGDVRETTLLALKARILVAEDNQVNQQVALEILQNFGCQVTLAGDGAEAVEYHRSNAYDLIFMDCRMPGLNGYEATEEIRRQEGLERHTPIIAMTAQAMKGDRERCLAAGMDDYISKPVDPERILSVLRRWIPAHEDTETRPEPDELPSKLADDHHHGTNGNGQVFDCRQALKVTGGKMPMFHRIATVFLTHMPHRIQELERAIEASDEAEIYRLAHSIQGASASIGGHRLWRVALDIETVGPHSSPTELRELFTRLGEEYERLRQALESFDWENPPVSELADKPGG
ncbi:MAG: response regulator [Candidatus Hydrogenedentes bacterium]|nr:response regulator [Candidatus Hydrogenedentota bacterium]